MSSREAVYEDVKSVLMNTFSIGGDEIAPEKRLVDDLDLDSIDAIDLAVKLEERIGVAPKGQDLRALVTVEDVVQFILTKRAEHGAASVANPPG
ncbi:MAG: acyl carrier protein [Planctomycetes bacterium]|nr:acyl carrier protein [Planctomycetota bacterium]